MEVLLTIWIISLLGAKQLEVRFWHFQLFVEYVRTDLSSNVRIALLVVCIFLSLVFFFASFQPKEK